MASSDRLGHADATFTVNTYVHTTRQAEDAAAEAVLQRFEWRSDLRKKSRSEAYSITAANGGKCERPSTIEDLSKLVSEPNSW